MAELHIVTVVCARSQFVKAAVVSRLIDEDPAATETLIHTGQHCDRPLSEDFFGELALLEEGWRRCEDVYEACLKQAGVRSTDGAN